MEIIYEKNQIIVFGKPIKYDALIKKIATLSGEQLYNFLLHRVVQIPRKINCLAMINVLNEKIKFLHSNSLSKDYFKRLQYYKSFSETQLVRLFEDIANDSESFEKYRLNIAKLILDNYESLEMTDGEINYLRTVPKAKQNSFKEYAAFISASALEQENTFDGQDYGALQKDLMHIATVPEIQELGKKYGVDLPDRLTKEQYIDYILYHLSGEGLVEEDTEEKLNAMTIAGLSQFAKEKGVPLQPQLDKNDIVNYLFYYLSQCEITLTPINEINFGEEFNSLDFTVDLGSISPFGNDIAKRIIHYDGEEDDSAQMDKILNEINKENEKSAPENVYVEAPIMPGKAEKLEIDSDEVLKEDEEGNLEVVEVIPVKEEIKEEPKTSVDNYNEPKLSDEEINKIIAKDKIKEEPKEPEYESKIDTDKITYNELYGSKKMKNMIRGKKRFILPVLGVIVLIAVVAYGIITVFG